MAPRIQRKLKTRLEKEGEGDDPKKNGHQRIVGKWSVTWDEEFPMEMESKRHSAGGNSYELKYRNKEKPKDLSFVEERPHFESYNDQGINASGRAQCLRQFSPGAGFRKYQHPECIDRGNGELTE